MKKILLLQALFFCFLQFGFAQRRGKPDSSFGTNGIVTGNFGKPYNYGGTAKKVLSQPDGSSYTILEVFGKTQIIKLLPGETIDLNYGQKGFSAFSGMLPVDAALQHDGKIVVAGNAILQYFDYSVGVTRFNTDGSIDTIFSTTGIRSIGYDDYSVARKVALQGDGKIVVAGSHGRDDGNAFPALYRLNTDGSYDTTFAEDGVQENYFLFGEAFASFNSYLK